MQDIAIKKKLHLRIKSRKRKNNFLKRSSVAPTKKLLKIQWYPFSFSDLAETDRNETFYFVSFRFVSFRFVSFRVNLFRCVLLITRLLRRVGRWARKSVNHTSWVALVAPTDRPKLVRNRCLIELFCGVVCVVTLPFWHFCWCRGYCHRTGSDLLLFVFFFRSASFRSHSFLFRFALYRDPLTFAAAIGLQLHDIG